MYIYIYIYVYVYIYIYILVPSNLLGGSSPVTASRTASRSRGGPTAVQNV